MRDGPLSDEDREGELGWRLLKLLAAALLVLTVGLILDALGVPGAAVGALVALALLMVLVYSTPLLDRFWRRSQ